uniref:Uncharacterized protein n=1 Tax=Anguilla anguilla TaxID=7936 RepID=A0A0E9TCM8_ANGAN
MVCSLCCVKAEKWIKFESSALLKLTHFLLGI